jgi:MFS family permease
MESIKNVKKYYLFQAFFGAMIIGPVVMIYLLEVKELSFTQAMLLNTVSALSLVIFDVPTGALADIVSRKLCLTLGGFVLALSLFIYTIFNTFFLLLLAEICFALGFSLISGADVAMLYDSLSEYGREDEFQEALGKAFSIQLWVQAVGSIIAGFVYDINVHLPFLISVVFMLLAGLVGFMFKEPEVRKEISKGNYFMQMKDSCQFAIKHKKIRGLILFTTVYHVFSRVGFFLYQPYMSAVDIPVKYFGVVFFVFNVVAALSSRHVEKIISFTKRKTLSFLYLLFICSFFVLAFTKVWIGVLGILLQQVARGLYIPVTRKYFNKYLDSSNRATILSLSGLVARLSASVAAPVLGVIQDSGNVFSTHLVVGVFMTALMYVVMKYMNTIMGRKEVKV